MVGAATVGAAPCAGTGDSAGSADGAVDPPALGHDLLVRDPGDAPLKLVSAISGPDDVRVRVYQAGRDEHPASIQRLLRRVLAAQRRLVASCHDQAVADGDGGTGHNPQIAQCSPALRPAVVGGHGAKLPDVDYQEVNWLAHGDQSSTGGPSGIVGRARAW